MEKDTFLQIQESVAMFDLEHERLLAIKEHMLKELQTSLRSDNQESSAIKCFPTHVHDLPCGCEYGRFLVADLADSYIRVSLCHLQGLNGHLIDKAYFEVQEKLWHSEKMEICDFIVECLQTFVQRTNLQRDPMQLAVVFCFPLHQTSLTSARPTSFTSNYKFSAEENTDFGEALRNGLKLRKNRIELVALLTDSTAVLLGCKRTDCKIGFVVGTRTNASYVEKTENIEACNKANALDNMIVNVDWSALSLSGPLDNIWNEFDQAMYDNCSNKNERLFEKMISGDYVAEVVRCIFLHCARNGFLFDGNLGKNLIKPFTFQTSHIITIIDDDWKTFENTRLMFDKLGITRPQIHECIKVLYIVEIVTRRTAALVSAAIACMAQQIGDKHIIASMDGSYFRNNSLFQLFTEQFVEKLMKVPHTCEIRYTADGSDTGAAVLCEIILQKQFIFEFNERDKLVKTAVSVENTKIIEIADNEENAENDENAEKAENAENVENAENAENADNAEMAE